MHFCVGKEGMWQSLSSSVQYLDNIANTILEQHWWTFRTQSL